MGTNLIYKLKINKLPQKAVIAHTLKIEIETITAFIKIKFFRLRQEFKSHFNNRIW